VSGNFGEYPKSATCQLVFLLRSRRRSSKVNTLRRFNNFGDEGPLDLEKKKIYESKYIYVTHFVKLCTMIFSFQYEEEGRVDKLDALLLQDVCRYSSKKIGFEVMGHGKHDTSNQGGM